MDDFARTFISLENKIGMAADCTFSGPNSNP